MLLVHVLSGNIYLWTMHSQLIFSLVIGDLPFGLIIQALVTRNIDKTRNSTNGKKAARSLEVQPTRKNGSCEYSLHCGYLWNLGATHDHNLWHKENENWRRRHLDIVHGRCFADDVRGHTTELRRTIVLEKWFYYLIICAVLIFILYVSIGCIIGRRKTRSSLQTKTFVIMFPYCFGRLFSHITWKTPRTVMNVVVAIGSTNVIVKKSYLYIIFMSSSFRSAYVKVLCCCVKNQAENDFVFSNFACKE